MREAERNNRRSGVGGAPDGAPAGQAFILADDMSGNGPVWLNILWPMLNLYRACFRTTHLPIPPRRNLPDLKVVQKYETWREIRSGGADIRSLAERNLRDDQPSLLVVWAASARNIHWTRALDDVWHRFTHRILHVCDTLQTDHVPRDLLTRFDLVTCFCGDLTEDYKRVMDGRAVFLPPHLDTIGFHSASGYRPIDLIVCGRRDPGLHVPLHRHFNQLDKERIYLDFRTKGQERISCEDGFKLLMSTYSKSAAVFCFEPSYMRRYKNRSPLLARWVHGWAAGCTVLGKTPSGMGTEALLDWPEATIDLPDAPNEAIEKVEHILNDAQGLERRRYRNVYEAIARHDTRRRLRTMFRALGADEPATLTAEMERLDAFKESFGRETGVAAERSGTADR